MKPCHAVAIVLVGWYLLGPPALPLLRSDPIVWDTGARLSDWLQVGNYDSANGCETDRLELIGTAKIPADSKCVATDDPRLKGETNGGLRRRRRGIARRV